MIKTWTIAILFTALILSGAMQFKLSESYNNTINRYDIVLDEMMTITEEQSRDILTYRGNERVLVEEIGGLVDALEYIMVECQDAIDSSIPDIEDTL